MRETDISTQGAQSAAGARFSRPYADARRQDGAQGPQGKRTAPTVVLNRGVQAARLERLRGRRVFDEVFARGRSASFRYFHLRIRIEGTEAPRVAVAAGKRLGPAVTRNRLRRRWRAVVRAGPELRFGAAVILVLRGASLDASFAEMERQWTYATERVGLAAGSGDLRRRR